MHLKNRVEAGQFLALKLQELEFVNPCILALPRGGVPVAAEIAQQLDADLDLLLVKKIGMPGYEELALGAIAEQGPPYWIKELVSRSKLSEAQLAELAERKRLEIDKQSSKWRQGKSPIDIKGRDVILVDDGLATGATMTSAVHLVQQQSPRRIIMAVPVAPLSIVPEMMALVDEAVFLIQPEQFFAVGQWYEDFTQVEDEEVTRILSRNLSPSWQSIEIVDGDVRLPSLFFCPIEVKAVIIFAHGSGSSHLSARHKKVADALHQAGFATLRFDLLSTAESQTRQNVFDIRLLQKRLRLGTDWVCRQETCKNMPVGYFGASTGAAAALAAAAADPRIFAIVSRGGRPDLAGLDLSLVKAPTLLIVGGADGSVISLNEAAHRRLSDSQVKIIPGAGHLFEEPGALEKVTEYAQDWFERCLAKNLRVQDTSLDIESAVLKVAKPIRKEQDLRALVRQMSEARVVMLGESTHGTEEFYRLRRQISQMLMEDYGFKFIAVEGDWPDCYKFNQYIKEKSPADSVEELMHTFQRWPLWMWANVEVAELIKWMKGRDKGFYGLDVYSLYESIEVLISYADKLDTESAARIRKVYGCFEPFEQRETKYAQSLTRYPSGCEQEAMDCLRNLVRLRLEQTQLDEEELFNARQNATIIKNAEQYYRAMLQGDAYSWNVRDQHMMETLDQLLRRHGEGAKAIVWAHNTHIGDYHATDMLEDGYINIGGLARERYGIENVYLVGFGTFQGEVLAGKAWSAKPQVMTLPPAAAGSYEFHLHKVGQEMKAEQFFFSMDHAQPKALQKRLGHRAVGVVYQSGYEQQGRNYVPTDLAHRYDAFIFVDHTSALRAIYPQQPRAGLIPETWPAGQ